MKMNVLSGSLGYWEVKRAHTPGVNYLSVLFLLRLAGSDVPVQQTLAVIAHVSGCYHQYR